MSEQGKKSEEDKPMRVVGGREHEPSQDSTTGGKKATPKPKPVHPDDVVVSQEERDRIRREWGLENFDEIDRALLTLKLSRPGMTDTELGAAVGLSRRATNVRLNKPGFKLALQESQMSVLAVVNRAQPKAAKVLEDLLESKDENIRGRAAQALLMPTLKRAGQGAPADDFESFLKQVAAAPAPAQKKNA